jgi:Ca2+-binding EF-hand superfamily protein
MRKYSKIVDLIEYYPMVVKKDKNFSKDLYYALSNGLMGDHTDGKDYNRRMNAKTMLEIKSEQMCEFVWGKIHEKFEKLSDAFRFFDADSNTKLSSKEFRDGLERLKIKLSSEDQELMFDFLDKDKNGWLSFHEFCWFLEENRDLETLEIIKKYKPFFKTNKKMIKNNVIEGYGIRSNPSDNIRNVMNYEYLREEEIARERKQQSLSNLRPNILSRANKTKASMMRDNAIIKKLTNNSVNDPNRYTYKLKQFINVPSSDYIRSIKNKSRPKKDLGISRQYESVNLGKNGALLQNIGANMDLNKSMGEMERVHSQERYSTKDNNGLPNIRNNSNDFNNG